GRLDTTDGRLGDDSFYDEYLYQAQAGERLLISLASGDFDTWLRWGRIQGGSFEIIAYDADGGGGTNSQLEVTVEIAGTYAIHANSYSGGATGAYTLTVESVGGAGGTGLPLVTLGQTIQGALTASDPVLSDNSHYNLYEFRGTPGQQVMVTMRSAAFDAYLSVGRILGDRFQTDDSDDDSGGGTDAQLVATLPSTGVLGIRANSLRGQQT